MVPEDLIPEVQKAGCTVSEASTATPTDEHDDSPLKRSITGRLLFFYVLGDVLGSGIYVLIGAVAGEVGGAFWAAFAVGVTVAAFTGLAYAELATKFPQAAGASLYVNKAFKNTGLTFMVTVLYLSATFAAAGSLAAGFAKYFGELWELPPTLLVMIVFIVLLAFINYIGITESVVVNMADDHRRGDRPGDRPDRRRDLRRAGQGRLRAPSSTSAAATTSSSRSSPALRWPSSR